MKLTIEATMPSGVRELRRRDQHWPYAAFCRGLVALAITMLFSTPARAATINVGPTCSLFNAITAANDNRVLAGCRAGEAQSADVIVLPVGSLVTLGAVRQNIDGPNGLPSIRSDITIRGNGSTIARMATASTPNFRIFHVSSGVLTLEQVTVTGGKTVGDGQEGGAIFVNGGARPGLASRLVLRDSTVSYSATYGRSAHGGAISARNAFVDIGNSTISNNFTAGDRSNGGGIMLNGGRFQIINSTITGNAATGAGATGGGVNNLFGEVIVAGGDGRPGIRQNIISGNRAAHPTGDDFYSIPNVISGGSNLLGDIEKSTFGALAGLMSARNDIVATSDGPRPTPITNILQTELKKNFPITTPSLAVTETHALVTGSPAINADLFNITPGNNLFNFDQRGVTRPQGQIRFGSGLQFLGGAADLGAYEAEEPFNIPGRPPVTPPPPSVPTVLLCDGLPPTRGCTVNDRRNQLCVGTRSSETIEGTEGDDVIIGLEGDDVLRGGNGNDRICGDNGADTLVGGNGNDRLFGGNNNDVLLGGNGNDTMFGGQGADRCGEKSLEPSDGNGVELRFECEGEDELVGLPR